MLMTLAQATQEASKDGMSTNQMIVTIAGLAVTGFLYWLIFRS